MRSARAQLEASMIVGQVMRAARKTAVGIGVVLVVSAFVTLAPEPLLGQGGPPGQGGRGQPAAILPTSPTAVPLPTLSAEVTGPGPIFDSAPSLPPGKGLAAFGYEAKEYFVSGTANGQLYTARIVVRMPAKPAVFSGLVLVEAMHGSGAAHMFEFTSSYTMSSGHAAVEILTTSPMQFVAHNEPRYRELRIAGGQTNEILAQVGADRSAASRSGR
jgi:hypothetical protein